jgi:hypothetical protein
MLAFAGTHSLNTRPVALHVTPGRPLQVGGGLHVRMGSPAMEAYSGHLTSASPATAQTAAFGQAHHNCQQELDVTLEANQVCVGVQAGCHLQAGLCKLRPVSSRMERRGHWHTLVGDACTLCDYFWELVVPFVWTQYWTANKALTQPLLS